MEYWIMQRKWPSAKERLQKLVKIDSETGCWVWQRDPQTSGYGVIMVKYKWWLAHRLSYTLYVGPIPEGKEVLHSCDVRLCCNPEHLFLGTQLENLQDMIAKGRAPVRDSAGVFRKRDG